MDEAAPDATAAGATPALQSNLRPSVWNGSDLEHAGLVRDEFGVFHVEHDAAISYPALGMDNLALVETSSWWFAHRAEVICAALARHRPSGRLWDVGGGNGQVAAALAAAGHEVGLVEPSAVGCRRAAEKGIDPVVCGVLQAVGFPPATLAAIGAFDVVEHIDDDAAFLSDVADLLMPGGLFVATVPAYGWLWSTADIRAGHFRRHTRGSISRLVRGAGLEPLLVSYFFAPLPALVGVARALPYRLGRRRVAPRRDPSEMRRDHGTGGGLGPRTLRRVLAPEVGRIARGGTIPFGGSVLVVAAKPGR